MKNQKDHQESSIISEPVASEYFGQHEADGETPQLQNYSKINKSTQQSIGSGFNINFSQNIKNIRNFDILEKNNNLKDIEKSTNEFRNMNH